MALFVFTGIREMNDLITDQTEINVQNTAGRLYILVQSPVKSMEKHPNTSVDFGVKSSED